MKRRTTTAYLRGISGIVLAAGYSARMGAFKPLLPLLEGTALETAIRSLYGAGVADIHVVVGFRSAELRSLLVNLPVTVVENPSFAAGMFSSIQAGVGSLASTCRGFFLLPADIPLVSSRAIRALARVFTAHTDVVYPRCFGKRGHPPLINAACIPDILAFHEPGGMRALLKGYEPTATDVEVDDVAIHLDMDTLAEYLKLAAYEKRAQEINLKVEE